MKWTTEDSFWAFTHSFAEELAGDAERSGVPVAEFRAGGRASKAWPNKEDDTWWAAHGPEMVDNWVAFRQALPNWVVWVTPAGLPAIELELNASLNGVPVKAYLDRVFVDTSTGELCIVDVKSGSRTPDSDLQLGFYRVLLYKLFGVEANQGYYWMARKGELTPAVDLSRFDEHLLGSMLATFERAIENDIFIPKLSGLCNSCGVNRACAAFGGAEAHLYDPLHANYGPETKEAPRWVSPTF